MIKNIDFLFPSILVFINILLINQIQTFNFDLNKPVFKHLNKDVYFGYTVAQHIIRSNKTPL